MFELHAATEAAPGRPDRPNEDAYLASDDWIIVLDGVSSTPGQQNGCIHGVRWFVDRLCLDIAGQLVASDEDSSLKTVLGVAIANTAARHSSSCDLATPLTPAATVGMVRRTGGNRLDWLVLGDVTVAWRYSDGLTGSATDDRLERLPNAPVIVSDVRRYDPDYVMKVRNKPGGFWVASSDPGAANEAVVGSVHLDGLVSAGIFSDGLARLAERYEWTWERIFSQLTGPGIEGLVRAVRILEELDPDPSRWRGKIHDDATGVIWSAS